MKFVQIGEYDYINVNAIVYINREQRIIRTNEADSNTYSLGKKYFDALIKEIEGFDCVRIDKIYEDVTIAR